jgi:hypothetical protein
MKADLEQLEKMQEDLFRQQCDLDIQKAMVKHFIKKKEDEQLTLTDASSMFSAKQMEEAWTNGCGCGESRSGYFDIENYS